MADVFGWLGATRRATVTSGLLADVSGWLGEWCANGPDAVVGELTDESAGALHWFRLGDTCLGFDRSVAGVGAWLAGKKSDANPLAVHLGEAAINALFLRTSPGVKGTATPIEWAGLPRSIREPRFGALHMEISFGEFRLAIALPRERVDMRAPAPRRPRSEPLVSRRSAADTLVASVRFELDLGELAVGEARKLAPGDVLVTGTPLNKLVAVLVGERPVPGIQARPGGAAPYRAMAIELADPNGNES